MRIAQLAPIWQSVPPQQHGGVERIISYITEELVRRGHDVTLFATGDSQTAGQLEYILHEAMRPTDKHNDDPILQHFTLIKLLQDRAEDFDLVHFHVEWYHFPVTAHAGWNNITTLHCALNMPGHQTIFRQYPEMPLISISDSQRRPIPDINWIDTIYHGLPLDLLSPAYEPSDELVFIGRISRGKGVDLAIDIAIQADMPLKIAAKVDSNEREYYEMVIKPKLDHPLIEFVGQVNDAEKEALLQNARALVFPIQWNEPFGMVMIEAMACGTPVIAYRNGSVPEVIDDGVTGIIVESVDQAVDAAVNGVTKLSQQACRRVFEEKYDMRRMVDEYERIYEMIVSGHKVRA